MAAAEVEIEDPVAHFNELFSKRYTEEDEDYMKTVKKSQIPPPVITDWLTAGYRDRYQGRGQDRGGRYDNRDQGRRGYDRDRSQYYGDRHAPYRRDDRSHPGSSDRDRGYHHGDRRSSYHRESDRYDRRDDRSGGRRDDRGDKGYRDHGRTRPATEYGSSGYYEFFY